MGHLPLGLHAYLERQDETTTTTTTQYVTFFREPVAKYVSGRLYLNRQPQQWKTVDEAVAAIRQKLETAAAKHEHYNAYERYLTTPAQKEEMETAKAKQLGNSNNSSTSSTTHEERMVELIATNLVAMNVLVGVVERMDTSLELLQSVLDATQELTPVLRRLLPTTTSTNTIRNNNTTNDHQRWVVNESRLSTAAVVERLQTEELEALWREYLRYEFRLYDFANRLHDRQVQALRRQHGDRYRFDSMM